MLMKLMQSMGDQKGFTLIELIFVVIILAVLTGIALINLGSSEDDTKLAVAKADLRTLATAIKVYRTKTGAFPATLKALASDDSSGNYKAMLDQEVTPPTGVTYDYDNTTTTDSVTITAKKGTFTLHSVTVK